MKILSLSSESEVLERELSRLQAELPRYGASIRQRLGIQLLELQQLLAHIRRGYRCYDRVIVYGSSNKFSERREKSSRVEANEIYDISEELAALQSADFSILGGLGGISLDNGHRAAELILLPGGTAIRSEMRQRKPFTLVVPPTHLGSIYPLAVFTGRKVAIHGEEAFFCMLEPGESILQPLKFLGNKVPGGKTITGTLGGSFTQASGYVLQRASPKTEWFEFQDANPRELFIYQTLLGDNISDFERTIHSHGVEIGRIGDRDAFGAHLYDARVRDVAWGIYAVAHEAVTVHY